MIFLAIAGNPDVRLFIDVDPVLTFRPVVSRARPTPRAFKVALHIELKHGGRRLTAPRSWRIPLRKLLVIEQSTGAMYDPDSVVGRDSDPRDLSEDPVVR